MAQELQKLVAQFRVSADHEPSIEHHTSEERVEKIA
jgi:hypothetical protein